MHAAGDAITRSAISSLEIARIILIDLSHSVPVPFWPHNSNVYCPLSLHSDALRGVEPCSEGCQGLYLDALNLQHSMGESRPRSREAFSRHTEGGISNPATREREAWHLESRISTHAAGVRACPASGERAAT